MGIRKAGMLRTAVVGMMFGLGIAGIAAAQPNEAFKKAEAPAAKESVSAPAPKAMEQPKAAKEGKDMAEHDVAAALKRTPSTDTFFKMVESAKLDKVIAEKKNIVIFALTDNALSSAAADELKAATADVAKTKAFISGLIVELPEGASGLAKDLAAAGELKTMSGAKLKVKEGERAGTFTVNGVRMTNPVKAKNGVIYRLSAVPGMKSMLAEKFEGKQKPAEKKMAPSHNGAGKAPASGKAAKSEAEK